MQRRQFTQWSALSAATGFGALAPLAAWAQLPQGLAGLSQQEAGQGLKGALEQGVAAAIGLLGQSDGFLGNPKVRIPLPKHLNSAAKMLRLAGQGRQLDGLVTGMNRAAEQAVPQGKAILLQAVREMGVGDAKRILSGPSDSVTTYFADKTRSPLFERFMPLVSEATERIGLAADYNRLAARAAKYGLIDPADANIQQHVTNKALDGLFLLIGEEERKIRQDPIGTGSALLQKVFGALK